MTIASVRTAMVMAMTIFPWGCQPDTSGVVARSHSLLTLIVADDGSVQTAYPLEPGVLRHRPRPPKPLERQCSEETLWRDGVLMVNWHVNHDCSVRNKPLAHAAGSKLRMMVEVTPADDDVCPYDVTLSGRGRLHKAEDLEKRARDVRLRNCFRTDFHHLPRGTYEVVRPDHSERFVVP